MIKKMTMFRDEKGHVVKMFEDYVSSPTPTPVMFSGTVRVVVTPPMNDVSQTFERDYEFPFTDDVTSVEQAFEKFDEIAKKRLDERNKKIKEALLKKDPELPLDFLA